MTLTQFLRMTPLSVSVWTGIAFAPTLRLFFTAVFPSVATFATLAAIILSMLLPLSVATLNFANGLLMTLRLTLKVLLVGLLAH